MKQGPAGQPPANAGEPPTEEGGRHRGRSYRPITPPGFWSSLKNNPRSFFFVVSAGLIAVGWGTETAFSGDADPLVRLAGAAAVVGGTLIWLSYLLYLKPWVLATPAWQQVPSRRGVVFVIRHFWIGAVIIANATWLANWTATV